MRAPRILPKQAIGERKIKWKAEEEGKKENMKEGRKERKNASSG
jgi:hypothetical protein